MRINSVRIGGATNSSSSHSIVLFHGKKPKSWSFDIEDHFGWDSFICSNMKSKMLYIFNTFWLGIKKPEYYSPDEVTNTWFKTIGVEALTSFYRSFPEMESVIPLRKMYKHAREDKIGGIDHQSLLRFPVERGATYPNTEFMRLILDEVVTNPNIGIIGGNDNSDSKLIPGVETFSLGVLQSILYYGNATLKVSEAEFTVMSMAGTKIRFPRKDKTIEDANNLKVLVPELLDVKITNNCEKNCSYCYMASKPNSSASWDVTKRINELLRYIDKGNNIMEVAIGGGEPLTSEATFYLMEELHKRDIRVAISTAQYSSLGESALLYMINKFNVSLGISINSKKDLEEAHAYISKVYEKKGGGFFRGSKIHIIPEVTGEDLCVDIAKTMTRYGFGILLLGYKECGRGSDSPTIGVDYSSLYRRLAELDVFAVDTVLAKKTESILKGHGVDTAFYYMVEGMYNKYLDLTTGVIGASSYHTESFINYEAAAENARGYAYSTDIANKFEELMNEVKRL